MPCPRSVRMGLNTGPVVVGSIGDNLRMDYTAVGDTTNLAARLQQHAEPGSILVSDTVASLARGYVTMEAVPPLAVKGKDDPVIVHRLLALSARRSRLMEDRALSPFVGRDTELQALRTAVTRLVAGQKTGVFYKAKGLIVRRTVYLIGPDGVIRFGQRGTPDPDQVLSHAA